MHDHYLFEWLMSYKDELLQLLEDELNVNPRTIADSLAQVIKGETIKRKFDSNGNLVQREVLVKPDDALRGAMVYDALHGGKLGIAPKQLVGTSGSKVTEVAHRRLSVDTRIIANSEHEGLGVDIELENIFESNE